MYDYPIPLFAIRYCVQHAEGFASIPSLCNAAVLLAASGANERHPYRIICAESSDFVLTVTLPD